MLQLAIGALVISIIAGALGFTGLARGATTAAKVLFGLFLFIAVVIIALLALGIDLLT